MIYLVQAGGARGAVKIGFSANVRQRVPQLRAFNHLPVRAISIFEGTRADEAKIHTRFKKHHIRGEWFKYEGELEAFCVQMAKKYPAPKYLNRAADKITFPSQHWDVEGKMPLDQIKVFWFNPLLSVKQVMTAVNRDRRYPVSIGYTTIWRHLGPRNSVAGRPSKKS